MISAVKDLYETCQPTANIIQCPAGGTDGSGASCTAEYSSGGDGKQKLCSTTDSPVAIIHGTHAFQAMIILPSGHLELTFGLRLRQ
jgi:hypothetical protein